MRSWIRLSNLRRELVNGYCIEEEYQLEFVELTEKIKELETLNSSAVNDCLIKLGEDDFINVTEIKKMTRNGNYTELSIRGESLKRTIWDEDRKIIDQFNQKIKP
jgi:hypothetical protein